MRNTPSFCNSNNMLDSLAFPSYTEDTPTQSRRLSDRQLPVPAAYPPPPTTRGHRHVSTRADCRTSPAVRPRLHDAAGTPLTVTAHRRTVERAHGHVHAATSWLARPSTSFWGEVQDVSILNDITSGLTTGFMNLLGIRTPDRPAVRATSSAPQPQRGARSSRTTFDPVTTNQRMGSGQGSVSLADALRQVRSSGSGGDDPRLPGRGAQHGPPPASESSSQSVIGGGSEPPVTPSTSAGALRGGELIRVFDASQATADGRAGYLGTGATLANSGPQDAQVAARNAARALDYYQATFGRSGIDGRGSTLDVVLNDRSTDAQGREMFRGNGGYYTTRDSQGNLSEAVRWGTGTNYQHRNGGTVDQASMLYADDLTIHEITHGIIKAETGSLGGTADESGSVNEAFADVMGASATRDWRIGEGMYTGQSNYRSMRNIARPNDTAAVHQVWTSMQQYRDAQQTGTVEEHYASGIISHAASQVQMSLGGERGWHAVEQVFYRTIDSGRLGDMSFTTAAQGLRSSALEIYGSSSAEYAAFDSALRQAGL